MDAKVEPKPGQLWVNRSAPYDMRVLIGLQDEGPWWRCYDLDGKYRHICIPSGERKFLRWATPAECRAAGLDPDAVLPPAAEPSAATPRPERPEWVRITEIPTFYIPSEIKVGAVFRVTDWSSDGKPMVDFGNGNAWWLAGDKRVMGHSFPLWEPAPPPATQAPQNMAQAAIDAYEARIKALEAERSAAAANYGRAMNERDAALRDAAEQRQRAERADAALSMGREAHAIAKRNADYFEREYVSLLHRYTTKPTPAPTQGGPVPQLTPEDRAWMDVVQEVGAHVYDDDDRRCIAAKAAIAARAKGV